MKIKQAFILAAGYGTRLRPLTYKTPKPLLEINGEPLLGYHLRNLKKYGIKDIIINTFYLSDQIIDYVKYNNFGLNISVSREEGEILGTAGGVMKQYEKLDDIFLVVYGDNLTNINYSKLFNNVEGIDFDALVCLYHEKNIKEKGMAVLDNDGYIKTFIEKPDENEVVSDLANAGIYIIKKNIFSKYCPRKGFFDFGHDFFPKLISNQQSIKSYIINDYLLDIGNINNYNIANDYVKKNEKFFI